VNGEYFREQAAFRQVAERVRRRVTTMMGTTSSGEDPLMTNGKTMCGISGARIWEIAVNKQAGRLLTKILTRECRKRACATLGKRN